MSKTMKRLLQTAAMVMLATTLVSARDGFTIPKDVNGRIPLNYDWIGASVTLVDLSTVPVAVSSGVPGIVFGLILSSGPGGSYFATVRDTNQPNITSAPLIEGATFTGQETNRLLWFNPPVPFNNGISIDVSTFSVSAAVVWAGTGAASLNYSIPVDNNGYPAGSKMLGAVYAQDVYATTQAALLGSTFTTTGIGYAPGSPRIPICLFAVQTSSGSGGQYAEVRSTFMANVTSTRFLPRLMFEEAKYIEFRVPLIVPEGCSANISDATQRAKFLYRRRKR